MFSSFVSIQVGLLSKKLSTLVAGKLLFALIPEKVDSQLCTIVHILRAERAALLLAPTRHNSKMLSILVS